MRSFHQFAIFVVTVALPTFAWAVDVSRLAFVARSSDRATGHIVSIVQAELAKDRSIALVERDELGLALAEQKLGAGGLSSGGGAVALGRVVRADLMAVLESAEDGDGLTGAIVIFDATTGVRLWDTAIPTDPEDASATISSAIRAAIAKRADARSVRTLCLLTVRNVDLLRAGPGFGDAVGATLQRRVLTSPGVAVLERERLDHINRERDLVDQPGLGALLPSLVMMEVDIAAVAGPLAKPPGDVSGTEVLATVSMYDMARRPLATARAAGTLGDPAGLAVALADAALRELAVAPAPVAPRADDRRAEAARFAREAKVRDAHWDWRGAVVAADAARALDPEPSAYRFALARALVMHGITLAASTGRDRGDLIHVERQFRTEPQRFGESFRVLRRAIDELHVAMRLPGGLAETDFARARLHDFAAAVLHNRERKLIRPDANGLFVGVQHEMAPAELRDLSDFLFDLRQFTHETEEPTARAAVNDDTSFDNYSAIVDRLLGAECHYFARTSNEYTGAVARWLPIWAKVAGKQASVQFKNYGPGERMMGHVLWGWTSVDHQWANQRWSGCWPTYDAVDLDNLEAALSSLVTNNVPQRFHINERRWLADRRSPPPPPSTMPIARAEPKKNVEPVGELPSVFKEKRTLLDIHAQGSDLSSIGRPLIVNDDLYVPVAAGGKDRKERTEVRVLRVPIRNEPAEVQAKLLLPEGWRFGLRTQDLYYCRMWLGRTHVFIYDQRRGLAVLPRLTAMGEPAPVGRVIAHEEFPKTGIRGAADLGDTVYLSTVGAAGSLLVQYDLRTGQTQTIAASQRQERLTPFDDSSPIGMWALTADPARKRIVFIGTSADWDGARKGLWEYATETRSFRLLAPIEYQPIENSTADPPRVTPVVDDCFVTIVALRVELSYDLARDVVLPERPAKLRDLEKRNIKPSIFSAWWGRYGDPSRGGSGTGDGTIARRLGGVPALSRLPENVYPGFAHDVGTGDLLVSDQHGIWLLKY